MQGNGERYCNFGGNLLGNLKTRTNCCYLDGAKGVHACHAAVQTSSASSRLLE
jgi:hypothetical protein